MNIFGTSFDYQSRLDKVKKLMGERGMDALIVHLWPNQYYLSGMYQGVPWYPLELNTITEAPLIIFKDSEPIFMTSAVTGNGLKEGTWIKDIRVIDKEPYGKPEWWEYIADALKEKGVAEGTIGIEEDICVISTFKKLQSVLPKAQFKAADEIFQLARVIKEPEEIELIKQSVLIAEAGLQAGKEAAKVGVPESEVATVVEIEMKKRGALSNLHIYFSSGSRVTVMRSLGANWKKIEQNDLCFLDIGCIYKGYMCDINRTWVVGKATQAQNKVASDLARIQEKVLNLIKPGVLIRETRSLGLKEMKNAGYIIDRTKWPSKGKGVGYLPIHGIGLGPMHDPPAYYGEKDTPFESGMTISVAAYVRYADFIICFEDNAVVVPGGIELINKLIPRHL